MVNEAETCHIRIRGSFCAPRLKKPCYLHSVIEVRATLHYSLARRKLTM